MGAAPQGDLGIRAGDSTVKLDYQKRSLKVVPVFEFEIRGLLSGYVSIAFGLFCLFVGLGASCLTTYLTASLGEPLRSRYFSAALIFLSFAFVFMVLSIVEFFKAQRVAKDLLKREPLVSPDTAR